MSSRLHFSYHPISEGPEHVWQNTKWRCNSVKIIVVSKTQGKMKIVMEITDVRDGDQLVFAEAAFQMFTELAIRTFLSVQCFFLF